MEQILGALFLILEDSTIHLILVLLLHLTNRICIFIIDLNPGYIEDVYSASLNNDVLHQVISNISLLDSRSSHPNETDSCCSGDDLFVARFFFGDQETNAEYDVEVTQRV